MRWSSANIFMRKLQTIGCLAKATSPVFCLKNFNRFMAAAGSPGEDLQQRTDSHYFVNISVNFTTIENNRSLRRLT